MLRQALWALLSKEVISRASLSGQKLAGCRSRKSLGLDEQRRSISHECPSDRGHCVLCSGLFACVQLVVTIINLAVDMLIAIFLVLFGLLRLGLA